MKIAIIGTAGRNDDFYKLTSVRYGKMMRWCEEKVEDLRLKGVEDIELVSGGAAWADHLAVLMFKVMYSTRNDLVLTMDKYEFFTEWRKV